MSEWGGGRGTARWIALSMMVALGALGELRAIRTADSLMLIGTNGGALAQHEQRR